LCLDFLLSSVAELTTLCFLELFEFGDVDSGLMAEETSSQLLFLDDLLLLSEIFFDFLDSL
jgi:hypothetical protein